MVASSSVLYQALVSGLTGIGNRRDAEDAEPGKPESRGFIKGPIRPSTLVLRSFLSASSASRRFLEFGDGGDPEIGP